MDVEQLNLTLLVASAVLLVAIGAVRVSARTPLPTLLIYLALGLVIGESGLGIEFENFEVAQSLAFAALVIILIEGGLTTEWRVIRRGLPTAISLATLGVAVSAGVTGILAAWLLGLDTREGLLIGAVLSSTDAAAVFASLRSLHVPRRLTSMIEAESGLNDPTAILLVLALTVHADLPLLSQLGLLAYELLAGIAIGLVGGVLGVALLRRQALPATGLYPLSVVSFGVLAYAVASVAGASGFAAVYVAALVLGNGDLPHRPAVRSFSEGLGWLAQIGLFTMLGLLASPGRLAGAALPALLVGLVLTLVARPVSVAISVLPWRLPWREQAFVSWAGLRGAVPIVLATIPLTEGVPGATRLFDLVFVLVIFFTVLQGPTLPWVARRLGVTSQAEMADLAVEIAPLERLDADLLHLTVPDRSRLNMVQVNELRLPPGAGVLLIIQGTRTLTPEPTTTIRNGDELLVVTPSEHRRAVERRFRLVHEEGRLARGWWGDPQVGPRPVRPGRRGMPRRLLARLLRL